MGRSIVVFSDGTGNSAASTTKTNVWRLYEALDLSADDQLASFDDGVGTSSFKPLQYLGLILGIGIKRNVMDLYKFICRTYRDEDRIYAFGFSRGAFTIRVLNDLICTIGLARYVSDEQLHRDAKWAYRAYRKKEFPGTWAVRWLRGLRDWVLEKPVTWPTNPAASHVDSPSEKALRALKEQAQEKGFRTGIHVHFAGVWDTVAAYGMPIDELTRAVDKWIWPLSFKADPPKNVDWARQALALDDERRTFFPIPWLEERNERVYQQSLTDETLLQVWFAGMHANVGGGYADDRLAFVSLVWMMEEASRSSAAVKGKPERVGLRFKAPVVELYRGIASPHGRIYDSRAGLGTLYRYHPRSIRQSMRFGPNVDPAKDSVPLVHDSVILRMAQGGGHYAPVALDGDIDVLSANNTPLKFAHSNPEGDSRIAYVAQAINQLIDGAPWAELEKCKQRGLDLVWWRRVLYYVMLGLVVLLVAFPLLQHGPNFVTPIRRYLDCIAGWSSDLADNLFGLVLSPLFLAVRIAGLGQLGPWIDAYEARPFAAGMIALVLYKVYAEAGVLQERIRDWTSAAWSTEQRKRVYELDARQKAAQGNVTRPVFIGVVVLLIGLLAGGWKWPEVFRPLRLVGLAGGAAAMVATLVALAVLVTGVLFLVAYSVTWIRRALGLTVRPGKPMRTLKGDKPQWRSLRFARDCRETPGLVQAYETLKYPVLPFIAVAGVAVALLWLPGARLVHDVRMGHGAICHKSDSLQPVDGEATRIFDADNKCWASGLLLKAGQTYHVILKISDDADWYDRTIHSDVEGFPSRDVFRRLMAVTKRSWSDNWFAPIVRIGDTEYSMELQPEDVARKQQAKEDQITLNPAQERKLQDIWDDDPNRLDTSAKIDENTARAASGIYAKSDVPVARIAQVTLRPRQSGELYMYVNDSVPLWWGTEFYSNNFGTATVTVTRHP